MPTLIELLDRAPAQTLLQAGASTAKARYEALSSLNLGAKLSPAAATAWMEGLSPHVTTPAQGQGMKVATVVMGKLPGWHPLLTRTQKIERAAGAWQVAYTALMEIGLPAWAEVAFSNVEALGGRLERYQGGESGGLPALELALDMTVQDLKEFSPLPGENELKVIAWLSRNSWWLIPTGIVGAGTFYFWPAIRAVMASRSAMGVALGQPALAFPPPESYDFTEDPFAGTEDEPSLESLSFGRAAPKPLEVPLLRGGTEAGFSTFDLPPLPPPGPSPWEQ